MAQLLGSMAKMEPVILLHAYFFLTKSKYLDGNKAIGNTIIALLMVGKQYMRHGLTDFLNAKIIY